jgi:GNAT superfamily N-acetyltransferase
MKFEISATDDDELLADFYRRHWLELGVDEDEAVRDWRKKARDFIVAARADRAFAGFVAVSDGTAAGAACCHRIDRVFPTFRAADAPVIGYLWGIYVTPDARGHGVGTALINACIDHLATQGCRQVLLHAGEHSRSLYSRLGFQPTEEMALSIKIQ